MSSALANENHQMVDNVMMVLPIEMTNTTRTHLQNLNEDCLLQIFSSNLLTLMDLCSLAETCKRFKQITQRMFSTGFAIKRRYPGCMYTFSSKHHSELKCTFQDIERIVKNFGPRLSELYMESDLDLVNLMAKYCDDITLKRLEICGVHDCTLLPIAPLDMNSPVARNSFLRPSGWAQSRKELFFMGKIGKAPFFRYLRGDSAHPSQPVATGLDMNSLIELHIEACINSDTLLRKTFPILEQFRFYHNYGDHNTEALIDFVGRHGCLKSVEIRGEPFHLCKLLDAIGYNCNELVELTLQSLPYNSFDISQLQGLTKLTSLNIGINATPRNSPFKRTIINATRFDEHRQPQCEDIDFSRAFKSLKRMEISFAEGTYVVPNQIFDVLSRSRVQSLRELKLVNCDLNHIPWTKLTQLRKVHVVATVKPSYGSDMLDVIAPLINLEELEFTWSSAYHCRYDVVWPLTEEEFSKIVEVVERRVHVLTLRCHYDFTYEENCNEERKVKLIKKPSDYWRNWRNW